VDHGVNGFIVEQSTPQAFAQAMRSALALEPERRSAMAMAARRFAEERIGIDAIAGRTLETMDALAGAIGR